MDTVVRVLAFDAQGFRRHRIDDEFPLSESGDKAPFSSIFRRLLNESPSSFDWEITLDGLAGIAVNWSSIFWGSAVATFKFGDVSAGLSIFLSGAQEKGERGIVESLAGSLGSRPGGTFNPAFTAFLQAKDRPLIAAIRFSPIDSDAKLSAVRDIERSLAHAFFRAPDQLHEPEAIPIVSA